MLPLIVPFIILPLMMKAQSSPDFYGDPSINHQNGLPFTGNQWIHPNSHHPSEIQPPPSSLSPPPPSLPVSPSEPLLHRPTSFSPYESNQLINDSPYPLNNLPMDVNNSPPIVNNLSHPPSSSSSSSPRLFQTPIQRRLFNPINRIILTLLGPRLMRYQMDMVVQAVMSEVIRKMVGPVLTAIAGRFVDPNNQQSQSNNLNFGLASALNSVNGGAAQQQQQQQQLSIPQLTLVPNQMPNGQIQLIIRPGGTIENQQQQQQPQLQPQPQQQMTNLQQLAQSLLIPLSPTASSSPSSNQQLYSSAQLQATLDQQISQQLAGKLPAQLIPQVAQQIQTQLQDKLPNIQLQIQQQLASQLANLQQQLGPGNQLTPTPTTIPPISQLTGQLSLQASSPSVPVTSGSPTTATNGIHTILVRPMSSGGLTNSSPSPSIYGSIGQSPRSSGLELTPITELNYHSDGSPAKSTNNVIGSYYVKLSPSQGATAGSASPNGQNHQSTVGQQFLKSTSPSLATSNGQGSSEMINSGHLLTHQSPQQIKVVLNPIELSNSLSGQNSPDDIQLALIQSQQQQYSHPLQQQANLQLQQQLQQHQQQQLHQSQQPTYYSANVDNNQQLSMTSDGFKPGLMMNHLYASQTNSLNPGMDSSFSPEQANAIKSSANNLTYADDLNHPDMGQYNNVRNIIEKNQQNLLVSEVNQGNSETTSGGEEEVTGSHDSPENTSNSHSESNNIGSEKPGSAIKVSPSSTVDSQSRPESTQETRTYSQGSGFAMSNYPPIPETKYHNDDTDNDQANDPNDQHYQTRSQSDYSPGQKTASEPLGDEEPENNNANQVEPESNEPVNENIETSNESDNGNNDINNNGNGDNTILPEHLKHMRPVGRDNIISGYEANQSTQKEFKSRAQNIQMNSGLTEIDEKERAIRWNTVLKNLDKYYGVNR